MGQAVDDARRPRRAAAAAADGRGTTCAAVDRELLGAGIHPGHPSLYEPPEPQPDPPAVEAGRPPGAPPVDEPRTVALALGLPMAVVAAVRATWSP